MELSIVIPVYKSERILPKLLKTIKAEVDFLDSFELILVNDSSPDSSWDVIKKLKEEYSFLVGINLIKNYSQHNAVMAGLNHARGNYVIIMDDDLQHAPSDCKKIYETLKESKSDVCYTSFNSRNHKKWKVLGSKFNNFVASILIDKPSELYLSPFKGFTKQIKDEIIKYDGPYPYVDGLILSITKKISVIKVEHNKRLEGDGNYTFFKSISLWAKMATGFSVSPLRVSTYLGLIISILSFILASFYIIQKIFFDYAPEGWTSIIVTVLFLGGIQLMTLGILGEYIGRIYLKLNGKNQYIVREKI